jgi:hypothetical protein
VAACVGGSELGAELTPESADAVSGSELVAEVALGPTAQSSSRTCCLKARMTASSRL